MVLAATTTVNAEGVVIIVDAEGGGGWHNQRKAVGDVVRGCLPLPLLTLGVVVVGSISGVNMMWGRLPLPFHHCHRQRWGWWQSQALGVMYIVSLNCHLPLSTNAAGVHTTNLVTVMGLASDLPSGLDYTHQQHCGPSAVPTR